MTSWWFSPLIASIGVVDFFIVGFRTTCFKNPIEPLSEFAFDVVAWLDLDETSFTFTIDLLFGTMLSSLLSSAIIASTGVVADS